MRFGEEPAQDGSRRAEHRTKRETGGEGGGGGERGDGERKKRGRRDVVISSIICYFKISS